MNNSNLDQGAIDAIVGGYHGAPFDALGPHQHGDDLVIRVFLPDAERVAVVIGAEAPRPMDRIHDAGLFQVTLPNHKTAVPYHLDVTYLSGITELCEDPCAFAPTLSDFDAHLMAEGTHLHI
nr:hypothetical protein [Promineifilum sp.]